MTVFTLYDARLALKCTLFIFFRRQLKPTNSLDDFHCAYFGPRTQKMPEHECGWNHRERAEDNASQSFCTYKILRPSDGSVAERIPNRLLNRSVTWEDSVTIEFRVVTIKISAFESRLR